jgi:prophage regulatory protein
MSQAQPDLDRIIRLPELLQIIGLSTASLYRQMAEGCFPRPVRLGRNAVGWRARSVFLWLDSLEEVVPAAEREADGPRSDRRANGRAPRDDRGSRHARR